jgi:hypothetical protein
MFMSDLCPFARAGYSQDDHIGLSRDVQVASDAAESTFSLILFAINQEHLQCRQMHQAFGPGDSSGATRDASADCDLRSFPKR